MEELQSTEKLDREILEDARKKAFKILKTADDTIKAKTTEREKETAASLDELNKKYAGLRERASEEIIARLPMDKQRAKAEKIERLLQTAVEAWYAGLSRPQVFDLLKRELAKRLAVCTATAASGEWRVLISGLQRGEAETLLKETLPNAACTIEQAPAAGIYPELVLETKELRITASVSKTVDFFLHEKRAELAEALLGQAALTGEES
ncbi:MAG: hypothetical protein LBH97_05640 [Treponema sp.]|jgi:vacuolar-type H+-ATPase subunit E/Vma4|nr:hypothetical protein [Treponema sp.]